MGLRFRLKVDFDISGYTPRIQVILRTMKKYGIIVADNGSNWFVQGTHDDRWNDEELGALKSITGSNFEAVDISPWLDSPGYDPNSAAVPEVAFLSEPATPDDYYLFQNYPNPFSTGTEIKYCVNVPGKITLSIFNIEAREIIILEEGYRFPGEYRLKIDAADFLPGVYFCRLQSGRSVSRLRKMIVLP
jgi:hypothetical protein